FGVFRQNERLFILSKRTHGFEVTLHMVERETLESCLRSEESRRPVELGINRGQRTENRLAKTLRQKTAQAILLLVHVVPRISCEIFVAAITAKSNRNSLARHLTNKIGGQ